MHPSALALASNNSIDRGTTQQITHHHHRRGGRQEKYGRNIITTNGSGSGSSTSSSSNSRSCRRLFMAAPGMSEAQRKNERDNEIRAKIAKLKREGKMKSRDKDGVVEEGQSQEDSTMKEAEAFMNKPSPLKKFAERKAARERREAEAEKEKKEEEEAEKREKE